MADQLEYEARGQVAQQTGSSTDKTMSARRTFDPRALNMRMRDGIRTTSRSKWT
jgi:hypothetical protein